MKKTAGQRIRLGIFVVLGTTLLTAALYFIGNRQNLFGKNITLHATFSNVNGLQLGNNVRYSGIDVGTVSRIKMANDTLVLVDMVIKENMRNYIRKNAVATIGSDGLVGNMIVNIIPRSANGPRVVSGDTIPSYSRIGTDDMLTTLNVTNENAALLTADLLKITTEVIEGKGTLGMLINDSVMAQDLKRTMLELRKASSGASTAIVELNGIISSIKDNESVAGVLLTDYESGEKMKTIIGNLENSSEDIQKITDNLSIVTREIKEGEGALNYLATDEELVRNIDSTMVNIKESAERFNENMEALRSNWLFRGYFKKQEKEARKKATQEQKNEN